MNTIKGLVYGLFCSLLNVLVLTIFEVTCVTTVDSQEPACCDNNHQLAS